MSTTPKWQFDEFQQVGRDYASKEEVEIYDSMHAQFRDITAESRQTLELLGLEPGSTVVDIGCGTGTFAVEAARMGHVVHAVDVSAPMLACAKEKAVGLTIHFHHAGFLTFDMPEHSIDAITTTFAFHHLPDFWKGIALKRLASMLKDSGQFYLRDVIVAEERPLEHIECLVNHQARIGGDVLRDDVEGHFRDENSTYDWVMDGLFKRAGFHIHKKEMEGGVLGTYICRKQPLVTGRTQSQ